MKIAFIGHALFSGGALQVGRNLLNNVLDDKSNQYLCILPSDVGYEEICSGRCEARYYKRWPGNTNIVKRYLYDRTAAKYALDRFNPDFVFGLGNFVVRHVNAKHGILYHKSHLWSDDSQYGDTIKWIEKIIITIQKSVMKKDLECLDLAVVQTASAEQRIRSLYPTSAKFVVMPNAVTQIQDIRQTSGLIPESLKPYRKKKILLCLSEYYPHKNLEILLKLAERHHAALHSVVIITTVTPISKASRAFLNEITKDKYHGIIVNIGRVPYEQIAYYYHVVDGMILPTLLESFSGTYVEAMKYCKPILTSDMDFARDVCGDAAQYFNPKNVDSIKDAICSGLLRKEELVKLGMLRYGTLSRTWEQNADMLMSEIKGIVDK